MEDFFKSLGQWFQKNRGRKPTQPIVGGMPPDPNDPFILNAQSTGQPSQPVPAQPAATAGVRSPELDELEKKYEDQRLIMGTPPPKAQEAKVDPLTVALSTVFSQGISDPGTLSRIQGIPGQMAAGEAATANQDAMNAWQAQTHAAEVGYAGTGRLIGQVMDKDAISEKLIAQAQQTTMRLNAQKEIADAKNNVQLIKGLGQLQATGGITFGSASQYLQEMHPEWAPDVVQSAAQQLMAQLQTDPSFVQKIQTAKLDVQQQKVAAEGITREKKVLQNVNATPSERLAAIQFLTDAGHPGYENLTASQQMAMASEIGAQSELFREKSTTERATRKAKVDNLLSTGKLLEARTEYTHATTELTNTRTQYFGKEAEAKIALLTAQAHKTIEEANTVVYKAMKSSTGLTANAAFEAVSKVQHARSEVGSLLVRANQEKAAYEKQLDALRSGGRKSYDTKGQPIDSAAAIQQLEDAIDATNVQISYLTDKHDRLAVDEQNINDRIEEKDPVETQPVTGPLSGEIKPHAAGGPGIVRTRQQINGYAAKVQKEAEKAIRAGKDPKQVMARAQKAIEKYGKGG